MPDREQSTPDVPRPQVLEPEQYENAQGFRETFLLYVTFGWPGAMIYGGVSEPAAMTPEPAATEIRCHRALSCLDQLGLTREALRRSLDLAAAAWATKPRSKRDRNA